MFDDQRYFFSLNDLAADFGVPIESLVQPLIIKDRNGEDVPILFETCEDMWAEDYRSKGESLNVTKMGIENGAELVINLSASPWTYGKNSARDRRVRFLAGESSSNNKPFLYVNCMGVQNNGKNFVTFDGGSTVYNREGHLVQLAEEAYQESLMIVDTDKLDQLTPIERCPRSAIAEKYDAIVAGIQSLQDIVNAPNRPKFVIGLSGGVDSAVVAALLVKAVGHENVVGINMPTQWNSQATQDAASSLAEALKIDYYPVPISEMVTSVESALKGYYLDQRGLSLSSLTEENIQAKTRGTSVLSNIAGNDGRFFTNNGNKLEIALGYATLYGDVGGAIAPIGDLLKSEVFEMARYLNREVFDHEVIPESLIPDELYRFSDEQIQPSAELKEQQVDPMKFGYHDAVLALATDYQKWGEEKIVAAFKEGTLHYAIAERLGKESNYGLQLMQRWGVDKADHFLEDITLFFVKMQGSVFKRVQAPGIVITSKSAFGFDIRESMIPYYETDALIKMREALQGTVYQPNEPSA